MALSEEQKEKIAAGIPAQRLGSGDDIAACVAFLASDQAAYITGQILLVDGGMTTGATRAAEARR